MSKAAWIKENLKPGEIYAGILLGKDGAVDQHLILLPGQVKGVTWEAAKKFAADAGGELPTRREQSLLFANVPEEFEARYYWSGEQCSDGPSFAWMQYFGDGDQYYDRKSNEYAARPVRRSPI